MDKIPFENNKTVLNEDIMNTFQDNIEKAINVSGHTILLKLNPQTYVMTLTLKDNNGNNISSDSIDLPIESMVVDLDYNSATKEIIFTLDNGNKIPVPIGDLISGLVSETDFNTNIDRIDKELQNLVERINNIGDVSSGNFVIDDTLSETSINPVQNKVIAEKLKRLETTKTLDIIVPKGTTITNETTFNVPKYIVGNNSLEAYWNGVRLTKATSTSDGHYEEVGQAGEASTQIKMHRTADDGNYTLEEDSTLTIVVRGEVVE